MRSIALVPLLAALAWAAPAGAATGTLNLVDDSGKLTLTLGDGTPVRSGTVVAPGAYDIVISVRSGEPQLQLDGPALSILWTVSVDRIFTQVLLPNSTYTISEGNAGGSPPIVFRTGDAPAGAPTAAPAPPAGVGESNSDVVGSARPTTAGTLAATLTGSRAPTLTSKGKPVLRLRRGRYKVSLVDRSASAGLALAKAGARARELSGRTFVGARTVTVVLTPGRWTLSAGTAERSFRVTA